MKNYMFNIDIADKVRKQRVLYHSSHENINRIVQMYASILSDILLGNSLLYDLKEIRNALSRLNLLINNYPDLTCYAQLRSELIHLKDLIKNSMKDASGNLEN